jgi:UDP-2-acetamido-2,6-beta-L-arabino-hexul-4-ose reductase
MLKIGITGQTGFIGTHLYNNLGLFPTKYRRVPFQDRFFENKKKLEKFVRSCDVIVHLAAMNRHNNPQTIYDTNIGLIKQLISACENTRSEPHILFASSTQEMRDNLYGKSKKDGRKLLETWANKNNASFSGLIIPNVFGPFGNPYYNSVVATFCHQLTHKETPRIEVDGELNLIYVGELVGQIIQLIDEVDLETKKENVVLQEVTVTHTTTSTVSKLLKLFQTMRDAYFERGEIQKLDSPAIRNLWNTFLCYIDHESFFPYHLKLNTDDRGSFVETVRLNSGGQVSFSTTKPGITRGNHFHTRKAERFAVIKGKARIELRRIGTDKVMSFELDGDQPSFVDMPIWHTHNITNIGPDDLYTIFWISEHYDASDTDTFFEIV